jgi:hypothetical protein
MQEAGAEELADEETHAARRLEVIHIGLAIGIDASEQRNDGGEFRHIVPGEMDAGGRRHGDQMDGVIGRAARGEQPHDAVHEGLLIDDLANRRVVIAGRRDGERASGRGAGDLVSQRRIGIDERRARQMQPMISMSIWFELAVP